MKNASARQPNVYELDDLSDLPEGWASTPLGDLVEHALGGQWGEAPAATVSDGAAVVKVIRGTEFRNWYRDRGITAAERIINKDSLRKRQLRHGDIVIEISGGGPDQPVGRTLLIDKESLSKTSLPLICSNFCRQIRLYSGLIPEYVDFVLKAAYQRGELNRFQTETTNLRNLNFTSLTSQLLLPIAPTQEQTRIALKIEELLQIVNASRDRLSRVPKILKAFRQSVLAAACSGRLTEEWHTAKDAPSWQTSTVANIIAEKPRNGLSIKGVSYKTSVRVLTLTATTSGYLKSEHFKYLDTKIPRNSHLWLKSGDVLLQRGNTPEYVGIAAIYESSDLDLIYPDLMIKIRPREGVLSKFLWIVLSAPEMRQYFREKATGSQGSMPKINQGIVENAIVSVPSLPEQQEIVRRIEILFKLADKIERRVEVATKRADKLTQAILAKAFRGELVPTEAELARKEGRDYEPASKLLARISVEREKTAASNGRTTVRR